MTPRKIPYGYYPNSMITNIKITKTKIQIGTSQTFLVVSYESSRTINIYVGGPEKWCIHCELIKDKNTIKPLGYLIKLRYDMLCSLEHSFAKGSDTKQLVMFLIQYINNKYPEVKELMFNDLSTRQCDNASDVNLAVMTYLYLEQTWYEKNFGAYLGEQSKSDFKRIKEYYNESKNIPWNEMSITIENNSYSELTDDEMETLYKSTKTWKEFFETIYKRIDIADFCMFISSWINKFILKYFNNLQGLSYVMPIKDYKLKYMESEYNPKKGGRRYTRKATRKQSKDYK
jgi:hypothetical protein